MNTARIAKGWALIADGAMELSLAYESIESPPARAGENSGAGGAQVGPPQPSPVPDVQTQHVTTALGTCPDHGVAWTVKPAGVGAKGPYEAFWRCNQKVGDGWCRRKPVKAWTDTHPLAAAA
jgi:hypothetical protein